MDSRQHSYSSKKAKRYRSAFTTEQVNYLEKEFKKFPYIGNAHRREVASALNIPERAVKIWFQNRRMKEKKETVIKEPEIEDQNKDRNVAFTNDSLNNVPDLPSTNDQRSNELPLLTSLEGTENVSDNKNITYKPDRSAEVQKEFYKELSPKHEQTSALSVDCINVSPVMKHSNPPSYKSSAEFSIDLCKKYRSDLIYNSQHTTQQSKKIKLEDTALHVIKLDKCEDKKNYTQNVPEDLSCNKDCKLAFDSIPKTVSTNNVGFQPVYVANYTHPYMPAGNMLWKPLNVMPIVSTGAPAVTIPNNLPGNLAVPQEHAIPRSCNCDCHLNVPNPINLSESAQPPHAQYIITAVPFQNYTKF
ncbi:zinc finger protein 2-like isoform X2 [Plodia interpunctella]|nr:zinc finger protein 2-like isoform X2 [Plodia interpunctella]XP_053605834.1 zinc finger protein 2-like isoform X2 [Plodia interpunctella]